MLMESVDAAGAAAKRDYAKLKKDGPMPGIEPRVVGMCKDGSPVIAMCINNKPITPLVLIEGFDAAGKKGRRVGMLSNRNTWIGLNDSPAGGGDAGIHEECTEEEARAIKAELDAEAEMDAEPQTAAEAE
jgi:hypothetical protein